MFSETEIPIFRYLRQNRAEYFGSVGEPGIQLETDKWRFNWSLARARELGLVSDQFADSAAKHYAGVSFTGGYDKNGYFVTEYLSLEFPTVVVIR